MLDLIAIGSPAVDYFFKTNEEFLKRLNIKPEDDYLFTDKKIDPGAVLNDLELTAKSPGGIAVNTAAVLAKLGLKTGYLGVIGKDVNGNFWLNETKEVETSRVLRRGNMSICACLLTNRGKSRTFLSKVNPFENDFINNIDAQYLNASKVVHIGPLIKDPKEGIRITNSIVKIINKPFVSFSPGIIYCSYGLKSLSAILKKTRIIFLNSKELTTLTHLSPKIGSYKLLDEGPEIVVCTMSAKGSIITTKERQFKCPRVDISSIVDTTGAGDSYAAGFLYGLLKNKSLEWSARYATEIAGKSLSGYGLSWLNNNDLRS